MCCGTLPSINCSYFKPLITGDSLAGRWLCIDSLNLQIRDKSIQLCKLCLLVEVQAVGSFLENSTMGLPPKAELGKQGSAGTVVVSNFGLEMT